MKEEVQNRVHAMRTKMGITQEDLAKAVGVSRQTIVAIEKGNYVPSVLLAMKIGRFFQHAVEDIFYIKRS